LPGTTAEKISVELAAYVAAHKPKLLTKPLFYTQRSEGFTSKTLTLNLDGIMDSPCFIIL
jgi:hypothetical protein